MRTRLTAGLVGLGAVALWSVAQEGCGSTPAKPAPATASGAFGVVTVNGKQELFLPVKNAAALDAGITDDAGVTHKYAAMIAVVDVGVGTLGVNDGGGTPALITDIDLGDAGVATATAGDATVVVAAGTYTYTVWFIDPTTNKVTDTISLDPSLNQATFSGGSGIVNGITIDEANHRAVLSVWNGLVFVDLASHQVTGTVLAAGAENFGFDSSLEYVLSPFYDCGETGETGNEDGGGATPPPCASYVTVGGGDGGSGGATITDGLNLINLKTNKVYTFENPDAGTPSTPLGLSPDSAAVDPTTGLAIVVSEFSGFYTFMDLSKAVFSFNGDAGVFTAPSAILVPMSVSDDGVAVEPGSHLAFFEEEFGSHVSLVDLTKVSTGASGVGPGAFADAYLPNLPDNNSWANLGDPHGIAVTTGIQTGDPVGFVVTDLTDQGSADLWVARVDLNTMLTLGSKAAMTLTSDQFAPAATYLDATRKE
jgi:hypothetical protein